MKRMGGDGPSESLYFQKTATQGSHLLSFPLILGRRYFRSCLGTSTQLRLLILERKLCDRNKCERRKGRYEEQERVS